MTYHAWCLSRVAVERVGRHNLDAGVTPGVRWRVAKLVVVVRAVVMRVVMRVIVGMRVGVVFRRRHLVNVRLLEMAKSSARQMLYGSSGLE